MNLARFQEEVTAKANARWPRFDLEGTLKHLATELIEATFALGYERGCDDIHHRETELRPAIGQELADIGLILLHLSGRLGYNLDEEMREKFDEVFGE